MENGYNSMGKCDTLTRHADINYAASAKNISSGCYIMLATCRLLSSKRMAISPLHHLTFSDAEALSTLFTLDALKLPAIHISRV